MKYFLTFFGLFTGIIVYAQSNSETFYKEKGKVRLYTQEEFNNINQVDSFKSSRSTLGIKTVVLDSSVEEGKKVISFETKYSPIGGGLVTMVLDKAYALKGKKFPDFKEKDISGKVYRLDDFKGKPTLINFWFHTCGPCKAEIPVLNKIMEAYADKVNFVALTYDSKDLIQPILDQRPFNFIQLINAGDLVSELSLQAAPKNLFLDKNGVIRQVYDGVDVVYNSEKQGLQLSDGAAIKKILDQLLAEK